MTRNLRLVLSLLVLAAVFLSLDRVAGAPGDALRPTVTLIWDQHPDPSVTGFRIYSRTNLSVGSWVLVAAVTNAPTMSYSLALTNLPGWPARSPAWFFMLTATNAWFESDPSNVVSMPGHPSSDVKLRISSP